MADTSELIERFGGADALAGALGISASAIRNWPARGIPGRWHLALLDLARKRSVSLEPAELLSTTSRSAA